LAHQAQLGYGFFSFVSYAPQELLVGGWAPVPFQPLVHPEHPLKHRFGPLLQPDQGGVSLAKRRSSGEHLTHVPALSFSREDLAYFAATLGGEGFGSFGLLRHHDHNPFALSRRSGRAEETRGFFF